MIIDGHLDDTDADQYDDYLYEEFLRERRGQNTSAQTPPQDESEAIREALNGMIETIENEVEHNRRNRVSITRTERASSANATAGNINRNNGSGQNGTNADRNGIDGRREPLFVHRRPYLRTFIRHLLVLDYAFMLLLFPFSLYNFLRFGFSSMTLSNNDFVWDIMLYWHSATNFTTLNDAFLLKDISHSLLYKFHNVVLYYSWPIFKRLLLNQMQRDWFQNSILQVYEFLVKTASISIYLAYGVGGTIYLTMASFFFSICLFVTIVRRYKNVQRMVAASLESSTTLPAVF